MDASVANNALVLAPRARPHDFEVGDHVWVDQHRGHPDSGLPLPRDAWVVEAAVAGIRVSLSEGGQPVNVPGDGRVVVSRILLDFRVSEGRQIDYALATNLAEPSSDALARAVKGLEAALISAAEEAQ